MKKYCLIWVVSAAAVSVWQDTSDETPDPATDGGDEIDAGDFKPKEEKVSDKEEKVSDDTTIETEEVSIPSPSLATLSPATIDLLNINDQQYVGSVYLGTPP